jgi:hypothetical protein
VDGGEHEVAGDGGLHGDLGGLAVADFADEDDVGVLRSTVRSSSEKLLPCSSFTGSCVTPSIWISTGSSIVVTLRCSRSRLRTME